LGKPRGAKHIPSKDTSNKEIRDLKQENKSLKRQIATLRKQIDKMTDTHMTFQQIISEEPQDVLAKEGLSTIGGCDMCQSSNVSHLKLPFGTLIACKDCLHRKLQRP